MVVEMSLFFLLHATYGTLLTLTTSALCSCSTLSISVVIVTVVTVVTVIIAVVLKEKGKKQQQQNCHDSVSSSSCFSSDCDPSFGVVDWSIFVRDASSARRSAPHRPLAHRIDQTTSSSFVAPASAMDDMDDVDDQVDVIHSN